MRGETMKDKSKKSTYSTTFGVDPGSLHSVCVGRGGQMFGKLNKIRSAGEVRYGAVAAFGENAGLGTGKFKARREILRLGNEIAYVDEN